MLYKIVKELIWLTLNAYFRHITVRGKQNIPRNVPIIFVANHPSAFMDPVVVAAFIGRKLHFITAEEFMGKGLKAKIYENHFNMIPVYRPRTRPGEGYKNTGMFAKCYDHLADNGVILIFPEGISVTEKRLGKIKTGVARIAYGAEQQNDYKLNVHIIPIGLNYSNPHRFRSDLYINVGKPIQLENFKNEKRAEQEVIKAITQKVQEELRSTILHVEDKKLDSLIGKVDAIYTDDLMHELQIDKNDAALRFGVEKDLISAVEYFDKIEDSGIQTIEQRIDKYLESVKYLGLKDYTIRKIGTYYPNSKLLWLLILGLPIFLIGWLSNIIPYELSGIFIRKQKTKASFRGSVIMVIALFVFLLWYILISIALAFVTGVWWIGLLYAPLAYLFGLFSLNYMSTFSILQDQKNFFKVLKKEDSLLPALIVERNGIIRDLEMYREQFDEGILGI